jgi:separase
MEIIESKFREPARDDLEWYEFEPSEQKPRVKRMAIDSGSDEDDSNDEDVPKDPSRVYWRTLQEQHLLPSSLVVSPVSALPHNWTVITINVAEDLNTLFVSRHRHDSDPLVFCLPLERQARRDGDAEGQLTFAEAISELADIIAKSNLGAKNAKDVEGKEGKIAWWAERRELDKRMEDLLSNIEFCWLGAFKVSLRPCVACEALRSYEADTMIQYLA